MGQQILLLAHQGHHVAHGAHAANVRKAKLQAELGPQGRKQVNLFQAVPLFYVIRPGGGGEGDGAVVKIFAENFFQFLQKLCVGHGVSSLGGVVLFTAMHRHCGA